MLRPTRDVEGEGEDHPEWKSIDGWLHWDVNPWSGKASQAFYQWNGTIDYPEVLDTLPPSSNSCLLTHHLILS